MFFRIQFLVFHLHQEAVRHIVALIFFVLYGASLNFEFLVGERLQETTHTIRFHPKGCFGKIAWECFYVNCSVARGIAIYIATIVLDDFEMLFISHVLRTLEQHMFKEVRKT